MHPFLAGVLFETWAAQFDRPVTPVPSEYHPFLATECPHIYPPAVPATFRGLKWGQR